MDISFFKTDPRVTNILQTAGITLTDDDIQNKVNLEESVNAGDNFTIGSCVIGTISFSVLNQGIMADGLTNQEFVWKQAVEIGRASLQRFIRVARSELVCINGNIGYSAKKTEPYLSIWRVEEREKIGDVGTAPAARIEGFSIVGNRLYCLHSESPYMSAYTISGDNLTPTSAPVLSAFEIYKVQQLCGEKSSTNVQGNFINEYRVSLSDLKPDDLTEYRYETLQMGLYTAEKPVKESDTRLKVTCYDRLKKFDRYVDSFLSSIPYPMTLKSYLTRLCGHVGVSFQDSTFPNQGMMLPKKFEGENVSGLQVLRWIAEAAGSFGLINPNGALEIRLYQSLSYGVDNSNYEKVEVSEFSADKIDKLQIRVMDSDSGVIVGTGENACIIENNPLLYAESDSEIRPVATAIFNAVKDIAYIPYSIDLRENPMIRAGHSITVSTKKQTFPALIMSKSYQGGKDRLEATGDKRRETQSNQSNQSIQRLYGKTNELTRTLDATISRISNAEGDISTIEQNVNSITLRVEKTEGNYAELSVNVNGISTKVTGLEKNYSQITQTVNSISFDVYDPSGKISSQISQAIGSIKLTAKDITLRGSVTLESWMSPNTTTIDGGNITAGTLNVDKIRMSNGTVLFETNGYDVSIYSARSSGNINIGSPSGWTYFTNGITTNGRINCNGQLNVISSNINCDGQVHGNSGLFDKWCYAPDWTQGSDERIKHDVYTLEESIMCDFVFALRPVSYRLNDDKEEKQRYGFIAQEVIAALENNGLREQNSPIFRDMNGQYGISYTDFIAPIVSTIQRQQKEIDQLKEELVKT